MSNFDRAFQFLIGEEGGYVNDPKDPGGETKYGISKRAYPSEDIKSLTLDRAKHLYKRDYWDRIDGDNRPWNEALCMFDCAVNMGVTRARELDRGMAKREYEVLYQAERALYYAKLKTFPRFGRGWMRRLIRVAIEATKGEEK